MEKLIVIVCLLRVAAFLVGVGGLILVHFAVNHGNVWQGIVGVILTVVGFKYTM